jgi:predicted dehydrogenase
LTTGRHPIDVSTLPERTAAASSATPTRVRVGVIGAGLIAQVMHLHYLRELSDRFEIAAICDVAPENAAASADRYGITRTTTDWRDLVREPIDAVLVLTGGSHAPMAIEAARAGLHVLVEKPMCFSTTQASAMVEAADAAGVTLMVAYNKRYDLAYLRFRDEVAALPDPRFLRVTTLESAIAPYVTQYPLSPVSRPPEGVLERLRAESDASITGAIGDADPTLRRIYHAVLLDTLVHELNAVRGLLGEPDRIDYVDLRETTVTVMLRFGDLPVAIHWIDLPGIARYQMELALYSPDRRVSLSFPSPFLRGAPTVMNVEAGEPGGARSSASDEITSYESSFKRELMAFHDAVVNGAPIATPGRDAMRDIALCQAIIECARTGRPIDHPTSVA